MDVVRPCMLALGSLPLYLLLSFIVKLNDSHSLFEYVTLRVTVLNSLAKSQSKR